MEGAIRTGPELAKNKKSLRLSFLDGIFCSGMVGFTQDHFTPFLLLLGGSARHVGFLSSLPNLFAALVQLKTADLTLVLRSRKKIMTFFVLLQALILIPMAFLAYSLTAGANWFIVLVTAFTAFGASATPAWGSLMSDLVAERKRGEYFGWRNKVLGLITVALSFLAGFILHQFRQHAHPYAGFFFIFLSACLFRLVSWYFLTRLHEPPLEFKKEDQFTLFMFLGRIRESNFARFVVFVALLNFSVNIASPFFAVFMLRDLHFNYLLYTFLTVTATTTIYLLMPRWGKVADQVGNLRVMKFTAPIIGILPLLWVINREPVILWIWQLVSGFAWAGFNLCASNFIYDAVSPSKRTRCIAYFNLLNGLALSLGAILGGYLSSHLPLYQGYSLLSLFIFSSLLRLVIGISLPSLLKEVRSVAHVRSDRLFFSVIGMKPLLGSDREPVQY